jgi:hypothetical protein
VEARRRFDAQLFRESLQRAVPPQYRPLPGRFRIPAQARRMGRFKVANCDLEHRRKYAVAICDRIQAQYPPPACGLHRTRRAHGRQYPQQPPRRRYERLCQANSVCRGRDTGCPVPPSQIPAGGIPAPGSSRWHVVFAHRKVCPFNPSFLRHGLPVCASPTRRPLLQLRGLRLAAGYYGPIRLPETQAALLVVAPPFLLGPRS